mmetsp:Transcript_21217/g.38075  ORF Transcript_21217/g.38075 Transcript_21217/m.38075 type:complete len:179 (-) Transcript_21217:7-543(-)
MTTVSCVSMGRLMGRCVSQRWRTATVRHMASSLLAPRILLSASIASRARPRSFASKVEVDPSAQPQGVILTDNFAQRMQKISTMEGAPRILRLKVEPGGCDGFSYKWYVCTPQEINEEEDRVFEHKGSQCVVDDMSLDMVRGATVDFVTELIGSEFKILDNPNAVIKCSCGASSSPQA